MNIPIIECKNISLIIEGKKLLHNISFTLEKEEDLVIFGPNGAGKTLLLLILSGNLDPSEGEIKIYGKSLLAKDSFEIKKHIGFVSPKIFEDYDYNSKVTDVVLSGLFGSIGVGTDPTKNNTQVVRDYIKRIITEKYKNSTIAIDMLKRVSAEYLKDEIFGHVSYGEKVRVLIARALINNPKIFILDEPTTGLDIKMRAEFMKVVQHLAKNADILYVTHYIEEILPEFQKMLLLKKGKVFSFGDKNQLLTTEKISQLLDISIKVNKEEETYFAWI